MWHICTSYSHENITGKNNAWKKFVHPSGSDCDRSAEEHCRRHRCRTKKSTAGHNGAPRMRPESQNSGSVWVSMEISVRVLGRLQKLRHFPSNNNVLIIGKWFQFIFSLEISEYRIYDYFKRKRTNVRTREGVHMNYKEKIIELVNSTEDEFILRRIYLILITMLGADHWGRLFSLFYT